MIEKAKVDIQVKAYPGKGRGVCTMEKVREGDIIERLPVLVIEPEVYQMVRTLPFINHTFVWDDGAKRAGAIGFGYSSLCNHSPEPNAIVKKDYANNAMELIALREIPEGEEVTIKYHNVFFKVV